jgi:hypothetical protein
MILRFEITKITNINQSHSSRPRGAVVRAEAQRSDDPCVPRFESHCAWDVGAGPSDETV